MLRASDFFDLDQLEHAALFEDTEYVWDALKRLSSYIDSLFTGAGREIHGDVSPGAELIGERIYIGQGTVVESGATIHAPAWIGQRCEVRQGAYLRGNVLSDHGCVMGHTSEFKNAILLADAKAAHFAYVGDSILGRDSNIGAGTKLSNLTVVSEKDRATGKRPTIHIRVEGKDYDTGLAKLGAIVGDGAQTGCNSVTNPGCLIGPRTLIYANVSVPKGRYPGNSMVKLRQTLETVPRR
ncbi:MAG: glucose-1-phosphate thymidylyltransferase [Proteobacteria bacterium]|nr:glucose-1-phosphate thymidylyltransferase [Pseudomonadota bacterium]